MRTICTVYHLEVVASWCLIEIEDGSAARNNKPNFGRELLGVQYRSANLPRTDSVIPSVSVSEVVIFFSCGG